MRPLGVKRAVCISMCVLVQMVYPQPPESPQAIFLGGIGNVASTATNFLSQAVETPRNLLINATRVTTGYSKYNKSMSSVLKLPLITKRTVDSAASRGLEFKMRRFLEKLRTRMRYGISELGIPILEPFHVDEIDLAIDNPEIGNITLVIQNLVIRDLSTFVVDKAKLSLVGPTITANISVPRMFVEGFYNISGILGDTYNLHGSGPFRMVVYNFHIYVNTVLGYSRGMYMKTFDLDFSLESVNAALDNFMGDKEIGRVMSQVFQELTPQALDLIKPDILPTIKNYIAGRVNETIHHLTMRDIFLVLLEPSELRQVAHLLVP